MEESGATKTPSNNTRLGALCADFTLFGELKNNVSTTAGTKKL
jgi:hypothetical protein